MRVKDYLDTLFDGNQAEFARQFSRKPQNVTDIFKRLEEYEVVITDAKDYIVHKVPKEVDFYTKENDKFMYTRDQLYKVVGERVK